MMPVYYDETEKVWKKADKDNQKEEYKWYNYDEKMWANAITTTATNRETYLNAEPGATIPMTDINTMWVWIPRYKYTYFASEDPVEIPIEFENEIESTGTIKCIDAISVNTETSETCTDTTNGSITIGKSTYTHPAFTFGTNELPGIWIGKFKNSATEVPTTTSKNLREAIIKPNQKVWKYTAISYYFKSIRNMEQKNNIYGFKQTGENQDTYTGEIVGDSNNIDTHMIKNMEWGAVAYFSHSKYGVCINHICKEIGINPTSTLTGCGATAGSSSSLTCNEYHTEDGKQASTTKNIYGIYDTSGGSHEMVMGNMQSDKNSFYSMKSGTWLVENNQHPLDKYYDKYSYYANPTKTGKLGDATIELQSQWYEDSFNHFTHETPWISRGNNSNANTRAGLFAYIAVNGDASSNRSSRSVLVLSKE